MQVSESVLSITLYWCLEEKKKKKMSDMTLIIFNAAYFHAIIKAALSLSALCW